MKKILFLFLIFILIIIIFNKSDQEQANKNKQELRGVYISYIEISKYLKDKNEQDSKTNIRKMVKNIASMNCNTIILQVRPSSDAIYYSSLFPISKYLSDDNKYPYDVLKYFIEEAKNKKIKVIAWINPYRISTTENIDKENPAYKYFNTDIIYVNDGIYYNPSKEETINTIISGVEEILKYDINGVLFDDYFYPNDEIDIKDYNNNNNGESLEEYHLRVVNNMVEQVHKKCKEKNIPFGIAPEGNIDNNYHKNYADVKKWLESDKYVDFIAPQIYYGFYNSSKPFIDTINEWKSIKKNKNINLYISLAFYKTGNFDNYAGLGNEEWINNSNIIMKEIIYSRTLKEYNGFILYRYDSIFDSNNNQSTLEKKNLKRILN